MVKKIVLLLFVVMVSFVTLLFTSSVVYSEDKGCEDIKWYVDEASKYVGTDPAKAEVLYREALKKCPESINTLYNLALALYSQDRPGESVKVLKRVLEVAPENKDALRLMAYILVKGRIDVNKGKSLAEKLLQESPDDRIARKIIMIALTSDIIVKDKAPERAVPREIPSSPAPSVVASSDIEREIPVLKVSNRDAIAVVIGNRDYQNRDIPSVDYAINDAETVKKYLINVLGYREGNIIYAENATKARFEAIFGTRESHRGKLYNWIKKGKSDVFIYYSGHGAPDVNSKRGYFVPSDADPEAISLTGYSLEQLYRNVAKTAKEMKVPNVFIVVDACFSGATEKGLLLKNVSPIAIKVKKTLPRDSSIVMMTSSGGAEVSSWYPEKGHSMFTYFFLKALKEEVKRGRKVLTAGRLYSLVSDETEGVPYYARRLYGRTQTPQMIGDASRVLLRIN